MNIKKEIDFTDRLVVEQKDLSYANMKELTRLREIQMGLDSELDVLNKRICVMRSEIENNEARIQTITSVLMSKEDAISVCCAKINDAHAHI